MVFILKQSYEVAQDRSSYLMKIKFLVIGKTNHTSLKELETVYENRIIRYCDFLRVEVPHVKNPKNMSIEVLKKKEGELLLSKISPNDFVVLLDENGQQFSSVKFASWLENKEMKMPNCITFVVGGAYGFDDELYKRANFKMSLSAMTYTYQMVRLIFLEQLYRAFTIIRNESYHHA